LKAAEFVVTKAVPLLLPIVICPTWPFLNLISFIPAHGKILLFIYFLFSYKKENPGRRKMRKGMLAERKFFLRGNGKKRSIIAERKNKKLRNGILFYAERIL
jgi:hypothetical protein